MNLCILIDCCVILFYFYFFHFFCGPRVDYREILSFTLNKQSFIINHYHYLLLLSLLSLLLLLMASKERVKKVKRIKNTFLTQAFVLSN